MDGIQNRRERFCTSEASPKGRVQGRTEYKIAGSDFARTKRDGKVESRDGRNIKSPGAILHDPVTKEFCNRGARGVSTMDGVD